MPTFESEALRTPTGIQIDEREIRLTFSDGSMAAAPLQLFPRLLNATEEQRSNWRWIGSRHGIHWPDVDEDIAVHTLVREAKVLSDPIFQVPYLIADLLRTTKQLERLFIRPFTPDGHLVGSIGEVVARYIYGLILEDCSTPQIDARTSDGRTVQIKLTGKNGRGYGIRWSSGKETIPPDLLLCLKLTEDGFQEIYAGAFPIDLLFGKTDQSNGQISLSVSRLLAANRHELAQVNSLEEFNRNFNRELASVA